MPVDTETAPAPATAAPAPVIDPEECKGCGRCVEACPKQVLKLGAGFNTRGYHYAEYAGEGCIGCCRCFYTCPEPWALAVRTRPAPGSKDS